MKKRLDKFRYWIYKKDIFGIVVIGIPICIWLPVCYFALTIREPETLWMFLMIFTSPLFLPVPLMALLHISNYDKKKMLKENEEYYNKMNKKNPGVIV